ncbi:MAG: hypothetical protein IT514_10450 [Burkholderiales bacterium]|nr:hypothetical protein [Burkholderiales bacterium]
MITDDARIVDPKSCQVETWVRYGARSIERWALPGCNLGGGLEITLGGATTSAQGLPDSRELLIQAKTILRPLRAGDFGMGLALGEVHNSEAPAHGSVAGNLYAYIPASVALAGWRLLGHANLGARRDRGERRTLGTWGLGAEVELDPRLYLIGEGFGEARAKPSYQLGFRFWIVPGYVQVDATGGKRLGSGSEGRWMSIGLRLLSPAFLP